MERNKKISISVGITLLIGLVTITFWRTPKSTEIPVATTSTPTTTIDAPKKKMMASMMTSLYKNGTYSAIGSYMSPGGYDQLGVTVTLASGIVTDVSLNLKPGDKVSSQYQDIFAANYKQYVVGQNIDTLNLGKVSKSSLTPQGFNNAMINIRSKAKS